jgi:hypothetical protein
MKRAPEIRLTERAFRGRKRREFLAISKMIQIFKEDSYYLPDGVYFPLKVAINEFETVYEICKPWWKKV